MKITITKEMFEQSLPVGISAHDSLFEKIAPAIGDVEEETRMALLGEEGECMVENEGHDFLRRMWVKYISITAFLSVLRQLDLVLTPTGFGVISSDKYAPASKMRVDALEGQLRNIQIRTYALLLNELRSKEWGVSSQAMAAIMWIYNETNYFSGLNAGKDYKDWLEVEKQMPIIDSTLRQRISDAQMDAVLNAFRQGDRRYAEFTGQMVAFCEVYLREGAATALSHMMSPIYRTMEQDLEKYTEWAHSKEYDAYHHEGFKNSRDSSAYIFG